MLSKWFIGQRVDRLAGWMSSLGGFEMAEIEPGARAGEGEG